MVSDERSTLITCKEGWTISHGMTSAEQRAGRHLLKAIVESQYCLHVMPLDAEAYEYPALIAAACMELATKGKPVTLVGKMPGDVVAFHAPARKKQLTKVENQRNRRPQ